MNDGTPARSEAIEEFASVLRELRDSVGNPSFREMSGRSGAISHTTLHEATKGNRLPSWGTTVEFVKACGRDPEEYREHWERANLAVRSMSAGGQAVLEGTPADPPYEEIEESEVEPRAVHIIAIPPGDGAPVPSTPPDGVRAIPPKKRRRFRLSLPTVAMLATAGVGVMVLGEAVIYHGPWSHGHGAKPTGGAKPSGPKVETAASSPGCPMRAAQPTPAPPLRKGDAAVFIADVTLPDCIRVAPGRTVTKVWRIKNTGTVRWKGYALLRLDLPVQADQCRTRVTVPIKETSPGGLVDIRTSVVTPKKPGFCYVRFKMVDSAERIVFPGNRPINFQVLVG